MHVFRLRSNGYYWWKCIVCTWISIYVQFLSSCMCVVGILMVVVFKHITFALLPSYVGQSIILYNLERHFHHLQLIEYLHASSQLYNYQLCCLILLWSWLKKIVVAFQCVVFRILKKRVISCFEEGVTIFIGHFLNLVLLMFYIVRSCRIISPSMECKRDNVMYMLCTLVEQCQVVGKGLLSSRQMFECLSLNIN
jgi:hypothetical protein